MESETVSRRPESELTVLDVNKDKIVPDCVSISRSQFKTVNEMLDYFRLVKASSISEERQFRHIINDNKYDAINGTVVDMAVGLGCEYLNMKGFFKSDKIAKVIRYAEIVNEQHQ